jgi:hypothetical protein
MSSTSTHNIHVVVTTTGLDTTRTALNTMSTSSGMAQKSLDGLGNTMNQTTGYNNKLRTGIIDLGSQTTKTTGVTNTYGKAVDTAGQKTQGLAAKFQGNKGAIFAFAGMGAAGFEAIGMFGMYQAAADKLGQAQDVVNKLVAEGAQGTAAYKKATEDVADAQRGYNFIIRNLALSFGDLVPFTLLAINAIVKMKETVAGSKTAIDAASTSMGSLGTAAKATGTTGIAPLVTQVATAGTGLTALGTSGRSAVSQGLNPLQQSAVGLGNSISTLDLGVRNTTSSTDELLTSTGKSAKGIDTMGTSIKSTSSFIGSKGTGLVAGVSALDLVMNKSQSTSSKFSRAFTDIGTNIKSLPGIFTNIGSSIAGFFTNFSGSMSKFGTILKGAGAAAMAFSKTMLLAFLSNPITAAIALISAAVLALITDFGGFRTAVNGIGKAIGDAIPPLKGILTYLGEAGNGALDAAASFLGVETQAQKTAKQAQVLADVLRDDMVQSLTEVVQVGKELQNLDAVVAQFEKLRTEIDSVTITTDIFGTKSVKNLNLFATSFETSMALIPKKSAESKAAIAEMHLVINELAKGYANTEDAQKLLDAALTKVTNSLGNQVAVGAKDIKSKEDQASGASKVQNATLGMSKEVDSFADALSLANLEGSKAKTVAQENEQALIAWTQKMGISIKNSDLQAESMRLWVSEMLPIAGHLDEIGHLIAFNNETGIEWGKTIDNITNQHKIMGNLGNQVWAEMKAAIDRVGAEAFPTIESSLELLKTLYPEIGKVAEEHWEAEKQKMIENGQYTEQLGETKKKTSKEAKTEEEKYTDSLQKTADQIALKAKQLQIEVDIQNLSNESKSVAVKFAEDEKKKIDDTRASLQQLALARGMDIENIEVSNEALIEHIKNNKLARVSEDEIQQALVELKAAREEDVRASALQNAVGHEVIATMKETIPVTQMTGEGIMQLVDTYFEIENATGIAADSIGLWYAELQKGEAINDASIKKMLELAKGIGVEIPSSIQDSVPDMQNYVSQILRIGDAAKKMKDDALAAFDELRNKAKSGLEKIFSDALGEDGDNVKKAIKGLDKIGTGIDSLNAKQIVIDAFLNDENYENDVDSLSEIIEKEYGDIAVLSQSQGFSVGDTFAENLRDAVGKKGKPVADQVDTIWAQVKASAAPGDTGNDLIARFGEALKKAGVIEAAIKAGATDPVLAELGLIPPQAAKAGTQVSSQIASGINSGKGVVKTAGTEIANEVASGIDSGKATITQAATLSIKDPITGEIKQIPIAAGTELAGVPGIFNQTFLDASTQAGTQLAGVVTNVHTKMSSMSTSVATYSESMNINFVTAIQNMAIPLLPFGEAIVALQTIISNLSSNIATYTESMTANINAWLMTTSNGFVDYVVIIKNGIQQVFSDLSSNIATYSKSMTDNINNWLIETSNGFVDYVAIIKNGIQKAFSDLSSNVATYMKSMTTNIENWSDTTTTSMDEVMSSTSDTNDELSNMSSSVASYMKSMSSHVSSFASEFSNSMSKVQSQAEEATSAVEDLQSAIDNLKDKEITIHVGLEGPGVGFMRHGGSTLNIGGPSYAAGGATWIQKTPKKIGNTHVAETFPEIISAIPLDPKEKNSPFHDLDMNIPVPLVNTAIQQPRGGGGGGPSVTQGDLYVTVTLPNGEVLARAVKPYMLNNYSGITSS